MNSAANAQATAIIVRVPRGIRSKQKLFAVLGDKLHFPAYFGWNWDALEELLCDLTWLPAKSAVVVHEDLPFGAGGDHRETYLEIARDVNAYWQAQLPGRLRIVLPQDGD